VTERDAVDVVDMQADEIGETFVPRRRAGVSFVEVDDELVVAAAVGPSVTDAHWLDRTASIVWSAFDGTTPLGELVDELAAAFGADRDIVRDDVIELTRTLGRAGLLHGIAYVAPAAVHPLRPDGLPVGTALPAFTRRDLDGAVVCNEDLLGASCCIVNWSPSCGYCVNVAAEIGALAPALEAAGVALILFATGSADENRRLLDRADLRARLLLDDDAEAPNSGGDADADGEVGLFTGIGTPSAYLVDAAGAVAAELAYGAVEVPDLLRDLAARPQP
jgi:peroxiredoxin